MDTVSNRLCILLLMVLIEIVDVNQESCGEKDSHDIHLRDIELRIVSLITRAREFSEDVIFVDLGSNDQTVELANEVDCRTLNLSGEVTPQKLLNY